MANLGNKKVLRGSDLVLRKKFDLRLLLLFAALSAVSAAFVRSLWVIKELESKPKILLSTEDIGKWGLVYYWIDDFTICVKIRGQYSLTIRYVERDGSKIIFCQDVVQLGEGVHFIALSHDIAGQRIGISVKGKSQEFKIGPNSYPARFRGVFSEMYPEWSDFWGTNAPGSNFSWEMQAQHKRIVP